MKIRNIALVASIGLCLLLFVYCLVIQDAYYDVAKENLILKDSVVKLAEEIINLKKSQILP
jgi:hypothetical protein